VEEQKDTNENTTDLPDGSSPPNQDCLVSEAGWAASGKSIRDRLKTVWFWASRFSWSVWSFILAVWVVFLHFPSSDEPIGSFVLLIGLAAIAFTSVVLNGLYDVLENFNKKKIAELEKQISLLEDKKEEAQVQAIVLACIIKAFKEGKEPNCKVETGIDDEGYTFMRVDDFVVADEDTRLASGWFNLSFKGDIDSYV